MAEEITATQRRRRFHPEEIALIVRQLREFRLWSTQGLASKAGVNSQTIEHLEQAESVTDVRRLQAVAQALGFQEYFFTDPVDLPNPSALRLIIERAKKKISAGMPALPYLPGVGKRAMVIQQSCTE